MAPDNESVPCTLTLHLNKGNSKTSAVSLVLHSGLWPCELGAQTTQFGLLFAVEYRLNNAIGEMSGLTCLMSDKMPEHSLSETTHVLLSKDCKYFVLHADLECCVNLNWAAKAPLSSSKKPEYALLPSALDCSSQI